MTLAKKRKQNRGRSEAVEELIPIGNHEVSVKMYNGQRVVTFKDIDTAGGDSEKTLC